VYCCFTAWEVVSEDCWWWMERFAGIGSWGEAREGRTDLGVDLLELVFDAGELLVGDLGDLVALVGHFGCDLWCVRETWCCMSVGCV